MFLTGRRKEKLTETQQEIGGDKAVIFPADVTRPEDMEALRTAIEKETNGALDVLVNNEGGVPAMGAIATLSPSDWHKVVDVNLTSQFLVTQAFLPLLRKSEKGKIVSVTSGMAHFFMKGFGAYSASKAAVEALMKTVGEEEKEHDIEVHLFDPQNVISEGNPQGEKHPSEVSGQVVAMVS